MSGQQTVLSVFCPSNLSFTQNQPIKFEILVFSPAPRNFTSFGWAELETTIQILLKLFTVLHCQDRKLMCPFFPQEIYLLDKTNQWNLKFPPSHQLEEISPTKFHISSIGFVYKINWLSKKLTQQFPVFTVRDCGKFQENLNPDFQFSLPESSKISSNRQEGQIFKFYWLVLSKR